MPPLLSLHRTICLSLTLLIAGCGAPADQQNQIDYNVNSPKVSGGTLINAMTGEPSGLISMIAGESASSAISSNIFNSLLKYDKNLELEGD